MARSKESKQIIKDIQNFMTWMKEAEVYDKYLTDAGRGFLDGLISADPNFKPDFVDRELFEKEKNTKVKLFGFKF